MSTQSVLSPEFLRSRGVQVTPALGDWLGRASFILRTRQSDEEKQRYQDWVLCLIEDAQAAGGTAAKDWAKQSPSIPANAVRRTPALLSAPVQPLRPPQHPTTSAPPLDHRYRLMEECSMRCPAELRPFLRSAFEIIDHEVQLLRMGYETVSFLRVLKVADQQRVVHIQMQQQYAPTRVEYTAPPPPVYCAPVAVARPQKRERVESSADLTRYAETAATFATLSKDAVKRSSKSKFVGKSTALERKYSRDEPLPDDIRPLPILRKAFEFIFQQSIDRCKTQTQDGMKYLSEQLKGMRQDLRVQNVRNSFCIAVYEASAKASLAVGDVGDFNQCQASLKVLYRELPSRGSVEEFTWYRLAYLAFGGQHDALALEIAELSLSPDASNGILALCVAITEGEGASVIEQCLRCPAGHMKALATLFLQRHRIAWLGAIASGARGQISSKIILHALGFHAHLQQNHTRSEVSSQLVKRGGKLLFDGSIEGANESFREILTVLKLPIPDQLDVVTDIISIACDPSACGSASFDAQQLSAAVAAYSQFLTTRRDATGSAEE
jgi:SAC3 family protein LENG8/THP3